MREIGVIDLGIEDYETTLSRQRKLVLEKRKDRAVRDSLFFVQHPDVYTAGRKSSFSESEPPKIKIERGGEDTFHNQGQLVCYPILSLEEGERDVIKYLRRLETVIKEVLQEFGIEGATRKGATGVWVLSETRKIASIGVALSSWITFHGCSLNVCNDLSGFSKISPCGFEASHMISMLELLRERTPTLDVVSRVWAERFSFHFRREVR